MGSTPTEENLIITMNIANTHPPMAQQFHFGGFILQVDIQSCAIMIKMIHCASLVTAKDEKQLKSTKEDWLNEL